MTEREKVISDLEVQIAWIRDNDFHKFPGWGHSVLAMRDALELLKAQEPIKPSWRRGRPFCGKCGEILLAHNHFCCGCGRPVKWE